MTQRYLNITLEPGLRPTRLVFAWIVGCMVIHQTPVHVSIRITDDKLGRCVQRKLATPERRALVYLAGLAAEHVATGRRPGRYEREVQLGILAHTDPSLVETFEGVQTCDAYGAVRALLACGVRPVPEELRVEVDRLYETTRESIVAVWPSVKAIAGALLAREELDEDSIESLLGGHDLSTPVLAIQRAHGLP